MSKQLNVSLAFTADTSQARAELQSLQTQLNSLVMSTKAKTGGLGISEEINKAIIATADLNVHLKKATNIETGNLDFAKFNRSIKQSGMTLKEYGANLQKLGPQGQQAFVQLAQSVATAEIPIRRSNALLQKLGTTMANTARWQLSSSMLHGFIGAISSAYNYAEDLNESLNNIRIVTGQNIDQMAKFAKEANKAAKSLSATTTDYTNASLIYYQQGLNDKEVKERTDITIKMANVARQSAEVVSDQMTAVWNNFADGTKPLEHYADVMTALGAATASSTDEIAGGLEKFAAIGDTIGLSFEYAASALATITSNTRQSEDVVGTALKTIFARIQGLKLGETLDDGTSLNKYSQALQTVGISIFDQAGELKKMDNILDEMGAKWGTLSKAQQTALAQTVAGVRQYTQLISLMDNWDNGDADSMTANLGTSYSSTGALQQQADIYAESWEAARDRVTASLESVYEQLLDDETFIDLLNSVEKIIGFVDDLVNSLGGLKGTLTAVGVVITKVFSGSLSKGLQTLAYNMKMATAAGRQAEIDDRNAFIKHAAQSVQQHPDFSTSVEKAQQASMESQLTLQDKMVGLAEKMTAEEMERNKMLLDRNKLMQQNMVKMAQEKQVADQAADKAGYALLARTYNMEGSEKNSASLREDVMAHKSEIVSRSSAAQNLTATLSTIPETGELSSQALKRVNKEIATLEMTTKDENLKTLLGNFKDLSGSADEVRAKIEQLIEQILNLKNQSISDLRTDMLETVPTNSDGVRSKADENAVNREVDDYVASIDNQSAANRRHAESIEEANSANKAALDGLNKTKGASKQWSDAVVECANVAFSAAMSIQMLGSMIDTLKDPDTSGWEKFTSVLMSLGIALPMIISAFKEMKSLLSVDTALVLANAGANAVLAAQKKKVNLEQQFSIETMKKQASPKAAFGTVFGSKGKDGKRSGGLIQSMKRGNIKDRWNNKVWESLEQDGQRDFRKFTWDRMGDNEKKQSVAKRFLEMSPEEKEAYLTKHNLLGKEGQNEKFWKDKKGVWHYGSSNKDIKNLTKDKQGWKDALTRTDDFDKIGQESLDEDMLKKSAGKGGLKGMIASAAPMLIAALGVAVIAGTVALVTKQINAAEEAVKKAQESARTLSAAYDTAKASYEEFLSSHSQYNEAIDNMDKLTKGTVEYQEALLKANEAAGNLLAKHKNLDYTIENGLVKIDEDSLEKAKKQELKNQQNAYAAKMAGEQQVVSAENDLQKRDMSRTLKSHGDIGRKASNSALGGLGGMIGGAALAGAATGAIAGGGVFSIPAAIVGALGGAIVGLITGITAGVTHDTAVSSEDKAIEALAEKAEKDSAFLAKVKSGNVSDKEFEELGIDDSRLIESLRENGEEVADLISEMAQNTAAVKAQNDLIASQALQDNGVVQNSKYKNEIVDITGDAYGEFYTDALDSKAVKDWGTKGISKATRNNQQAKKVFKDYLKYAGLEGQGYTLTNTTGSDKNREFVYTDKDGKEQKVSLQAMQAAKAAYEASNKLSDSATKLANKFEELAESSNKADQALLSFLSKKDFGGANNVQFSEMWKKASAGKNKAVELNNDNEWEAGDNAEDFVAKQLGVKKISKNIAIEYGYENAKALVKGFTTELIDAQEAWDELNNEFLNDIKLNEQAVNNITLENAQGLKNQIEKINLGPMGKKAGEEYLDHLNSILAGVKAEDQQEILAELTKIDWSDWDAVEQAKQSIKDLGININMSANDWANFTEKMREAAGAIPDFSKLKSDLQTIAAILKDLELGSVIDEQDYEALIDAQPEWEKFFILQSDGTRKFIGNEKELQNVVKETIKLDRKKLATRKEYADKINNSDKINMGSISNTEVEKAAGGDGKDGLFKFTKTNTAGTTLQGVTYKNDKGKDVQRFTIDDKGNVSDALKEGEDKSISQQEASDILMTIQKAKQARELINTEEEDGSQPILNALTEELGYSTGRINEILNNAEASGNGEELQVLLDSLNNLVNTDYGKADKEYDEMMASTATSLSDLDSLSASEEWDSETEQKALKSLGSSYEACRKELEEYNKAIEENDSDSEEIIEAEKKLRKAIRNADWRKVTKDVKKYWSELKKLKDVDEIADKQKEVAEAFNKAWGTNVSSSFVKENEKLIDEWANSTGDKATELALEIKSKAVMASTEAKEIIGEIGDDQTVKNKAGEKIKTVEGYWRHMKTLIEENPITINAKGKADLTSLMKSLFDAGYNAQQVANFLASIGQTEVHLSGKTFGEKGLDVDLSTPDGISEFVKNFGKTKIEFSAESVSVPDAGVADMSNYSSGDSGGGSEPKKTSEAKKSKSDMVDRYKEINDELEETGRQMTKNTTIADGLWGEKRFAKLRQNIKLMKQERKELEEKYKLSKKYLKEDKNNLKKQSGLGDSDEADEQREALGMTVNFKFDENGYITNYTSEMTKLYEKRQALLRSFGSTMDEEEQKRLEEFDTAFENLTSAYEQYEQTLDERDDLEEEKLEKKLKQQEEYLKLLQEEADLRSQINEADLEVVEYYLDKVQDDAFSQIEGLGYLGQQANIYADNLSDQRQYYNELTEAFKNKDINEPQYKEELQKMQSVTIENLKSLQDAKTAMQDYYGNTLKMAQEELAAFTDQMEHLNSVFDHYSSLLDLLGKRKDYSVSGSILMGKANNIKNEMDVYKDEYALYAKEAAKWEKKMLEAEIGSNKYETYKKNWEAAQQAANEAQDNMLAKTEEWAEAMRAVVENNLQGLAQELEATLTNGSNFDTVLNSMERANSLQEEYLTATNKIYETNKLMRTAQQEIDKTSNEVAKRKMKEFIAETKHLQNKEQLSKYELDIQQAKYDLLLAEIALEEAQNAKSTVRLQRDSEGNFGYVYTADNSKVAEAEQKMADAQNKLYNIGLQGANDYNQKYAEAMSEMYNDLAELQQKYLEGQFASEDEYQKAVEASKEYHYNKLKQFSSLYQVALTTDSRVISDAWSTDFNNMIYKTEEWKSAIDGYTSKAASELAVWAETVSTVISTSGLDNIDSELDKMAKESEKLKNVLVGDDGLIEALKEQVKEVGKLSQKYLKVQKAIDEVIKSYEKFLGKVNKKFTGTSDTGATVITLPTPQGYDTGGYTGEWGSWGKLAMLHEKEMVLNKEDTSNLLKTMEFLDNIIKTIDLQATNAALGGLLSSPSFGGLDQHDVLEQNVKIEASFPNVSNRAEIEEAFETLVNRASQYANRK